MVRQRTVHCGRGYRTRYREVQEYFYDTELKRSKRGAKSKESPLKQIRLNERYSMRYLHRLVKSNFSNDDYRIDLTYDDTHLPGNEKEGDGHVRNFIKKLQRERKRLGIGALKYIWVNENFNGGGRPHHHLLVNGGIDRDVMESMWSKGKGRGAASLGMIRAEHLRFDNGGIEGLIRYMTKQTLRYEEKRNGATEGQINLADLGMGVTDDDLIGDGRPKGRRRWRQSKNLIKPHDRIRNNAMTKRQVLEMVGRPCDCEENKAFFEKRNPGYVVDTCRYDYNTVTGLWGIYVTMHRRD